VKMQAAPIRLVAFPGWKRCHLALVPVAKRAAERVAICGASAAEGAPLYLRRTASLFCAGCVARMPGAVVPAVIRA
jgi:hypothetical protein